MRRGMRVTTCLFWYCLMTGNDLIKKSKNFKKEGKTGKVWVGEEKRVGYCLLPTSSSCFASFFWEWHQQPTQGASLFICPLLFHSTSSSRWSFPSCVRFRSWWNYLFRSMCPHAHHITLNHAQSYYTYDWLIWMCFFRMLQNNQLERLPDDAPWDLPNLLSLWVFIIHMHTVIMLLDHRQHSRQ